MPEQFEPDDKHPSWPAGLRRDLLGPYSTRLYGAPGAVDLDHVHVLWPALLSRPSQNWLCEHRERLRRWPELLAKDDFGRLGGRGPQFHLTNAMQNAAVWVHGAERRLRIAAPDGTWVEVAHCQNPKHMRSANPPPMWFSVAPGTGVWVNVGRSLVVNFTGKNPLLRSIMNWTRREEPQDFLRLALAKSLSWANKSLHGQLGTVYDTVQFIDFLHPPNLTNLILIQMWGFENDSIATHLNRLRCGPAAARTCNASEEALKQQEQCAVPRRLLRAMKPLVEQNMNCSAFQLESQPSEMVQSVLDQF